MQRPPQAATASIFGRGMVPFIVVLGLIASLVSLGVGLFAFRAGDAHWQTLLFTTLIFSSSWRWRSACAPRRSRSGRGRSPRTRRCSARWSLTVALQLAAVYVPFLQTIFGTTALPAARPAGRVRGRRGRAAGGRGLEVDFAPRGSSSAIGRSSWMNPEALDIGRWVSTILG